MMSPTQAICTKYVGPTERRGSRIIATSASGIRVIMPTTSSKFDAHQEAALKLQRKLNWEGKYVGGGTKDGYCFVDCFGCSEG